MVNTNYFLRHAKTQIDMAKPPNQWNLSKVGKKQAKNLLNKEKLAQISILYCSTETKTFQTIQYLVAKKNISISYHTGLNEIGSHLEPQPVQTYLEEKKKSFEDLDYLGNGSETYRIGLTRFKQAIDVINAQHTNKTILIVSHGTILSLYFADLLGMLEDGKRIYQRWKNLPFCALGIVEDKRVKEDINE